VWQPCEHCELLYTRYLLTYLLTYTHTHQAQSDLVYYCEAVLRPVMEYASPIWHSSLTSEQSKTLEAVQRRACQIIRSPIGGGTYSSNCSSLKLDSLHTRRQQQPKKLFNQIVTKPENCLHYMLPTDREQSVTELSMGWVNPWVGLGWVGSTIAKVLKI